MTLIWVFWTRLPFHLILPTLSPDEIASEGNVQEMTLAGGQAGPQTYYIYFPKGYNDSLQEYAVLYHLHGAFLRQSWLEQECQMIGSQIETAVSQGIIEPMIIVCPFDPDGNRMWSDSHDGRFLQSTALIQDLIPHVDKTYRTIGKRNGRYLQGFSMGGFGTLNNGFLHPELFQKLIVWDGAIHNWQTLSTNRAAIASKMFATEATFKQWSPWALTEQVNANDPDLFIVVGQMPATRDFGDRFKPHLEQTGRSFIYYDSPCPHSLACMMDELGNDAFAFLATE
ncbi:MAG: alpha/beta hydrolase-fold protein [Chloroflexota bacterium]